MKTLYNGNKRLFFASLVAIIIILFSMYSSYNTLTAYTLERENNQLKHQIDSMKKHYDENEISQTFPKNILMAL
jgi:cell division protein FtsL